MTHRGGRARAWFPLAAILLFVSSASIATEFRTWTSASGKHSLEAELLEQGPEFIELGTPQGQSTSVRRDALCEADLLYLEEEQARESASREVFPLNGPFAALNALRFGSTRDEAMQTLRDIPKVKAKGKNSGSFSLKVGGERFELFLDFCDDDLLSEVNLWSQPHPEEEYRGRLEEKWRTLSGSMSTELESADLSLPMPMLESLDTEAMQNTHIWELPGQSFSLDVCKARGGYACVFRSRRESYLIESIFSSGDSAGSAFAATAEATAP